MSWEKHFTPIVTNKCLFKKYPVILNVVPVLCLRNLLGVNFVYLEAVLTQFTNTKSFDDFLRSTDFFWFISGSFASTLDGRTKRYDDLDVFFVRAEPYEYDECTNFEFGRVYNFGEVFSAIYLDDDIEETCKINFNGFGKFSVNIITVENKDEPFECHCDFARKRIGAWTSTVTSVALLPCLGDGRTTMALVPMDNSRPKIGNLSLSVPGPLSLGQMYPYKHRDNVTELYTGVPNLKSLCLSKLF